MGFIVAADGSWGWRVARVLIVAAVCAGAVQAQRLRPGRAAAITSLSLGVVATAVGATIAASYLTRSGLSVKAVGGVLATAGGLAVAITGGLALLRAAVHGWRRLLAVPVGAVLAYALVMPLCVAVFATNVPRPRLGTVTPADRGLSYLDAGFKTSDGVTLSGWYIESRNRAAVVLLHGASSTRVAVLDQAAALARHGYGVLLFDARGHGRSGGRAMEFGWYGDRDVEAAVSYLQNRPDVDSRRIGAVGMSMGGEEVIGAMAADPRIKAAVAEGATNRVLGDKQWLSDVYGLRGRLQQGVEWLTYGITDLLTEASRPISLRDAVRVAAPQPVLLIAAGTLASEHYADKAIQAASPATVELWLVPGADHIGGLRTAPREWERRVSAFLGRALLQHSVSQ
jgi:dienelactone hydrolase